MSELTRTVDDLLRMRQAELDDLFRASAPGPVPAGEGRGTVILAPGRAVSGTVARLAHLVAWRGKVFDPATGELRNEVGPLGTLAVRAKVYVDRSWFDGRDSIVLDYSQTSLVAHWIRDEIRLIAPQTYLGVVYWGGHRVLDFALRFSPEPKG